VIGSSARHRLRNASTVSRRKRARLIGSVTLKRVTPVA
jgi:hypothetical protein